jgi:hypothetical protein
MQDQAAFRVFFNEHLNPILREFEQKRRALLLELGVLLSITAGLSIFLIFSDNLAILLFVPILLWAIYAYLTNKIEQHIQAFKPRLIPDILAFMKVDANYSPQGFISKDKFIKSGIFGVDPSFFRGEDMIVGKSGQIRFEICELLVIHPSEAKAKLEKIFDGVFLFTEYSQNCNGRVFLVPKSKWQRNSRGIKNMIRAGATELEKTGNTAFDARFRVFYDQTVNIKNILSARLQENMIKYHDFAKAEVYASFINSDFYLAMHESFDLLDSSLFRSNLSFEKIYGFFRDLQFYLQIVEDIDRS